MNRRSFLKASSVIGVGGLVGASALISACSDGNKMTPLKQPGEYYVPELPDKAIDGKELKVGLVGCGGRGNGAIANLLEAANGIKVHALGDVFADRLEGVRNNLKENYNQEVPAENCFIGFDAYCSSLKGISYHHGCCKAGASQELECHYRYSTPS